MPYQKLSRLERLNGALRRRWKRCRRLWEEPEPDAFKDLTDRHGIPVLPVYGRVGAGLVEELRRYRPDLICIASFNQLLPKTVLAMPTRGAINLHPSLLPYYPGPNPIVAMIMHDEERWGVTVHFVDEREDTGPIVYQRVIEFLPDDSGRQLADKMVAVGAELLAKAARDVLLGQVSPRPQPAVADRRRGPRLRFEDLLIDVKDSAKSTYQFLNRLLFFAKPYVAIGQSVYQVTQIADYSPRKTTADKAIAGYTRGFLQKRAKYVFPDGELELLVRQTEKPLRTS